MTADIRATVDRVEHAARLAERLVDAWGSWHPTMTADGSQVAFVSDRGGVPQLWVQDLPIDGRPVRARHIPLTEDPVLSVAWSADDAWLACAVATGGGVRTQVWVVRPDGSDARRVAGSESVHAELGPWTRSGHRVVVTFPPARPGEPTRSCLADPATGALEPLAEGGLISVLDLSAGEELVVLRDGRRGHQFCVLVDRVADSASTLLPHTATGATDVALLRPAPPEFDEPMVAYLVTEEGLPRRQLVARHIGPGGIRGRAATLASRDDAELEGLDADDAGNLLLLVWNVAGRSELELLDPRDGERRVIPELPGAVATHPVLSRDGGCVVLAVEGPERPRELWRLDTGTLAWTRVSETPELPADTLVAPTLETFVADDGLELSGWLYRPPGRPGPGPAMLHLHGGPEAQERPVFSPQHQALAAAGIAVFAPNIRGSSGFGREFVHADDVGKRYAAFGDVLAAARFLADAGIAPSDRIAVTGRSYGGYLTFAMLAFHPERFAAGVAVCGMSDLLTFYRDTEPWIGEAAYPKYGHPVDDRALLEDLSPLSRAEAIRVPLLVAHGSLDTNVPVTESRQIVGLLHSLGRPVEYLEQPGEGHEYRRRDSRVELVRAIVRFLGSAL